MIPLWIIGAGGHAKVVIDAARASQMFDIRGCLDDRAAMLGTTILGVPVAGQITEESLARHDVQHAIVAIGSNVVREKIVARLSANITWVSVLHPSAIIAQTASIGEGTVICAGAIVQPDTVIGRHVILNTGASVDHDSRIDDFAHIGPGTHLAGEVAVGPGAFLGVGTSVIPGRQIGRWSVVGAGTVVIKDVPAESTVVGVPGRVIATRG